MSRHPPTVSPDATAALVALLALDRAGPLVDWTLAYECDRCKTMARVYDEAEAHAVIDRRGLCVECVP